MLRRFKKLYESRKVWIFSALFLLLCCMQLCLAGCQETGTPQNRTDSVQTTAFLPVETLAQTQAAQPVSPTESQAAPETRASRKSIAPETTTAYETTAPETMPSYESPVPETGAEPETRVPEISGQPQTSAEAAASAPGADGQKLQVEESGQYSSKEEVALYLHQFGHLPSNYLTKKEAEELGWVSSKGNLWKVAPGMSIGGSRFGNYEGHLPDKKSRKYYECDIDYDGGYRNEKRIIYSNDGLIFYTEDHYNSFEQLY